MFGIASQAREGSTGKAGNPFDMSEATAPAHQPPTGGQSHSASKTALAVGAIGIVFGDIGTSPLYAFRETFAGTANIAIDRMHVLGVVSLIFWSMLLVVAIQYVTLALIHI